MDPREAMMSHGTASYYMPRGMLGSVASVQGTTSMHPLLTGAGVSFQSSSGNSSVGQMLVVDPSSTMSPRASVGAPSALTQSEPVRRKRGRPQKYGVDSSKVVQDITTKIMSFLQQGSKAICILSANGAVTTVALRQPSTSGGTVTNEEQFEILSLRAPTCSVIAADLRAELVVLAFVLLVQMAVCLCHRWWSQGSSLSSHSYSGTLFNASTVHILDRFKPARCTKFPY